MADATSEDGDKSLRQRISDRWNSLGAAGKAGAVVGTAAALAGGILAFYDNREQEADHDPGTEEIIGSANEITSLPSLAATEQNSASPQADPKYVTPSWTASPYERNGQQVAGSTRNRRKDLLAADS
ncbi:hypothetical protein ACH4FV_08390 [Streptomyces anulatus]